MQTVLTGAAGGIGRAIADRLSAAGHDVLALDRRDDALGDLPAAVETEAVDLTDAEAVETALAGVDPDALITAAGWYELGALEECSPARLRRHVEANLLTVHTVVFALASRLRRRNGRIVVVGSLVGRVSLPYHGAYSASKAGLAGYVGSLRRELADRGVDVSLVEPGPVATGLNERASDALEGRTDSAYRAAYDAFEGYRPESASSQAVADAAVTAATAPDPDPRYPVGTRARLLPVLQWLLPASVFDTLVAAGMPDGLLGRLIDG
ncbi:SDR family NAD(P)-dependent oxidoreductase [Natronomonas sp.]|uniref:SDR family NAD(P)-dependent oxidoreductase n=1 Tax=Natronomonas sp. TaxID=2184060 RepID=UPI0026065223|nr:SDR family NAD(P)-dependent oxidoreductase [Natronomonas sp.]